VLAPGTPGCDIRYDFGGATIVGEPIQLTLEQASNRALKQNHSVHLRSLSVEQMQSRKDEARSNYLP
jgi:outer membrane protein TolC